MKRFRPYVHLLSPVKGRFFLALVAGLVAAGASSFGLPLMLEKVFPVIFGDADESAVARDDLQSSLDLIGVSLPEGNAMILVACLMLPCVFLVRGVASFVNSYYINYVGLRVLETIRIRIFSRFQQLSLSYHQKQSEGDLLSRVLTDTNVMQTVLIKVGADLIVQPATLIGAVGFLTYASLKDSAAFFMLIAMLSVPVCVLPIRFLGKKLLKRAQQLQGKLGDMTAGVSENLASQREIRSYNLQQEQIDAFRSETSLFMLARMKVVKYTQMISPSVEIVAAFGVSVAIFFGVQNDLTLEKFLPLVAALYFAYEPIKKLGNVHGLIKTGEAALDRVEAVIESDDEIREKKNPVKPERYIGEVEFNAVSFGYEQEKVLDNLNVHVPHGQTVALVGPSGAGKSSFIALIPRFYDVQEGCVKVDGVDVKELGKNDLRQHIAMVSQSPLLFRGTISENILLGKPGASQEEVETAAKNANAHDFILGLPDGYATALGERGEGLSGGQRQRVAIARAFLKDAPILILDEATSALDTESESQIQQSLEALSKGRTTFVIAHRFSSIKHADRILVFNKSEDAPAGQIIADGTHEELYDNCSLYRDLYDHQS